MNERRKERRRKGTSKRIGTSAVLSGDHRLCDSRRLQISCCVLSAQPAVPSMPPDEAARILPKCNLRKILDSVAPEGEKMEPDLEEALLNEVVGFLDNALYAGCELAHRRKSDTLEPRDVALALQRQYH
eukprot:scaffold195910_cov31-Prasinocladus_malaysianus.AAC.1